MTKWKRNGILSFSLCVLCIGICSISLSMDDSEAAIVAPPEDAIVAGDLNHGIGYYFIDDKEATFIGFLNIPGNEKEARFDIASYLVSEGTSYGAIYEPDASENAIPVSAICAYEKRCGHRARHMECQPRVYRRGSRRTARRTLHLCG